MTPAKEFGEGDAWEPPNVVWIHQWWPMHDVQSNLSAEYGPKSRLRSELASKRACEPCRTLRMDGGLPYVAIFGEKRSFRAPLSKILEGFIYTWNQSF